VVLRDFGVVRLLMGRKSDGGRVRGVGVRVVRVFLRLALRLRLRVGVVFSRWGYFSRFSRNSMLM
jgi:hypothetical protein